MMGRQSYPDLVAAMRAGAVDVILKHPKAMMYLKDRVLEAAGKLVGSQAANSVLAEVRAVQEEFFYRFVDAERRALDLGDRLLGGKNNRPVTEEVRVLMVDPSDALMRAFTAQSTPGYQFENALSGGQALDLCGSKAFQIVIVSKSLHDLPASMVVRSLKTQNPAMIAIHYSGPEPAGKVELVETNRTVTIVEEFKEVQQLVDCLDDLTAAYREKAEQRRYAEAFRERHADFIRKFVELKLKIDRSLA